MSLIVQLPFAGFYESRYSDLVYHEESQWIEYQCEKDNTNEDAECTWPEALRLDYDLGSLLWPVSHYSKAYAAIARDYVDAFDDIVGEALGYRRKARLKRYDWQTKRFIHEWQEVDSMGLKYESMDSPKEYNFTTDRVYATVSKAMVKSWFKRCREDGFKSLDSVMARRHKSRDGFISHYSHHREDWSKNPCDWDHNQLETLLIAVMEIAGLAESDWDWDIYYRLSDGSYQYWESCVDWSAFEKARDETRAQKLADWMESDREAALAWRERHYSDFDRLVAVDPGLFREYEGEIESAPVRCPLTLDLFNGTAL